MQGKTFCKKFSPAILLFNYLLKRTIIVCEYGQEAKGEAEVAVVKTPFLIELGAAGVRSYAVLTVVEIHDRFFKRCELVIVGRFRELLGREMRAIEAEISCKEQGVTRKA